MHRHGKNVTDFDGENDNDSHDNEVNKREIMSVESRPLEHKHTAQSTINML